MPWKLLILLDVLLVSTTDGHLFGYGDEIKHWPKFCSGRSEHQSPIHIYTPKAIPLAIPALEMVGFHNLLPRPVIVTNSGHSVELKAVAKGYGKIFGALLDGQYEVEGIHFHWGSTNNKGSEHRVNGVRFPMEMHIVTRSMKYQKIEDAIKYSDGLAVLAFFFHLREDGNKALEPILRELEILHPDGSRVYLSHSFPLSSLLPKDTDVFYTYRGSLTTPPCSEAVTWIIFPDPLPVSYNQLSKFRSLSSGKKRLLDNFRLLQDQGTRKVFVRRNPNEFSSYQNIYYNVSSPIFWGTDEKLETTESSDSEFI